MCFQALAARRGFLIGGLFLAVSCLPAQARAQLVFESVGERALGMAGAFVAVADDATAVHWNPAGLVSGGPAAMTIGWHRFQVGNQDAVPVAGPSRGRATLTSLGTWPLGVSYGTLSRTDLVESQDGSPAARSFQVSHFGVTILQSIVSGLVVGSTVKVLRGRSMVSDADGGSVGAVLEAGEEAGGSSETAFDLDVGVMATSSRVRAGVMLKNVRSPAFAKSTESERRLPRQARAGIAVLPADGVTLAIDLDLNTVDLAGGLRRMCAIGGETRIGSRVLLRSGVRWSLSGARRPVGAVGASLNVRRSLWLDGHYASGGADEDREVGVALRAGY